MLIPLLPVALLGTLVTMKFPKFAGAYPVVVVWANSGPAIASSPVRVVNVIRFMDVDSTVVFVSLVVCPVLATGFNIVVAASAHYRGAIGSCCGGLAVGDQSRFRRAGAASAPPPLP